MPTKKNYLAVSIRLQKSLREKLEANLYQYTRLLQEMEADMGLVLDLQELSRQKLARRLHDGLTQTVASLAMRVNFARRLMETDPEASKEELLKIEELTRQTAKDIRHMIFFLRRMDIEAHGLNAVLELMVDKMGELFDLKVYLSIEDDLVEGFTKYKQKILYSMIEEGIDNARRYAEAENIWVRLTKTNGELLLLEIEDDGKAEAQNEQENRRKQLERMLEYARIVSGTLEAESIEGKGSCIQILIPIYALTKQGTLPSQ
jgi:two-component system sensor histidine kinase DegS